MSFWIGGLLTLPVREHRLLRRTGGLPIRIIASADGAGSRDDVDAAKRFIEEHTSAWETSPGWRS